MPQSSNRQHRARAHTLLRTRLRGGTDHSHWLQRTAAGRRSGGVGRDTSGGRTISDAIDRSGKGTKRCETDDGMRPAPYKETGSLTESTETATQPTRRDSSSSSSSSLDAMDTVEKASERVCRWWRMRRRDGAAATAERRDGPASMEDEDMVMDSVIGNPSKQG